jgi:uncharacterized SAM-binding protein YcdF (DUF218 family)
VILAAGRRAYAPEFGGETVDGLTLERLRYGAVVTRATGLPVLVSGGLGSGDAPSLAAMMAQVLHDEYGIEARWREGESSTTMENARFSAALLRKERIGRILLVTHAWHMQRAASAFRASGLAVIAAPTAFYRPSDLLTGLLPDMGALRMSGYALHELIGSAWYAVRYH